MIFLHKVKLKQIIIFKILKLVQSDTILIQATKGEVLKNCKLVLTINKVRET